MRNITKKTTGAKEKMRIYNKKVRICNIKTKKTLI